MYRIGLILGPAMFVAAVVEWIVRLTHYAELIEKTLPWTQSMIDPVGIWVTMLVGILIFLAAWAERKKERREGTKHSREIEHVGPHRQTYVSSVGNIDQNASPVNTVNAGQRVEIHNHPPVESRAPALPIRPPKPVPTRHNVQFAGAKRTKTVDLGQEIFDGAEGFVGVKACFLNRVIPGAKTGDFNYVRARIVIRDRTGAEVAEITKPKWLNHEAGDPVHIEVNQAECLLLAVFGYDLEWAVPFVSTHPANYWDDGTLRLMVDGRPLPIGELSAEITLVGEDNIGLDPVTAHFSLGPRGEVEIKPGAPRSPEA